MVYLDWQNIHYLVRVPFSVYAINNSTILILLPVLTSKLIFACSKIIPQTREIANFCKLWQNLTRCKNWICAIENVVSM